MRCYVLLAAASLAAPVSALPASAAASVVQEDQDRSRDDEVVCRREYSTTSRMGASRRTCMTRAEWAARQRQSNRAAGDVAPNGTNRTTGGVSGSSDLGGGGR